MQDVWLRLFLAATISAMGILVTFGWSRTHRIVAPLKDEQPIARITTASNDVQRRPAERLIWQRTLGGEDLHSGEAIRTGRDGTARIEFIGKDAYAEIEPDTVIEIEETALGLNLDFLVGNLVIKSTAPQSGSSSGKTDQKITVQSGGQKLEVKDAEVSVTKTNSNSTLDVDVLKGKVDVLKPNNEKVSELPKLKIIRPKRTDSIYGDPELGAVVTFEWEPIKPANNSSPNKDSTDEYEVSIETGRELSSIKLDSKVAPVPIKNGQLQARVMPGKTFFRLTAKSKKNIIPSVISSMDLKPKLAPQLLAPFANADVVARDPGHLVDFRWDNYGNLVDMKIEIARTNNLKSPIVSKPVGDKLQLTLPLPEGKGTFYWRMSGYLFGTQTLVSSPIQKFSIERGELPPLISPKLLTPESGKSVGFLKMRQEGLWLNWDKVPFANGYEVSIAGHKVYRENTIENRINISKLLPGIYQWTITANDGNERKSPESEIRSFIVEQNPILAWADGLDSSRHVHKTDRPTLKLGWEGGPGNPTRWRVRILGARQPASEKEWRYVANPEMSAEVTAPGNYQIEAESVDIEGKVIARTPLRTVQMELAPTLKAPEFMPIGKSPIRARANGTAELQWLPVDEAKHYILNIKKDGEIVQTVNADNASYAVKDLKSGDYSMSLQVVDSLGRPGPEGKARTLTVPEFSEVRAPKIKAVKVK